MFYLKFSIKLTIIFLFNSMSNLFSQEINAAMCSMGLKGKVHEFTSATASSRIEECCTAVIYAAPH